MTEIEIREEILRIKEKYYTPTSKIALATGIDRAFLSRFLNEKLEVEVKDNTLRILENWLKDRSIN